MWRIHTLGQGRLRTLIYQKDRPRTTLSSNLWCTRTNTQEHWLPTRTLPTLMLNLQAKYTNKPSSTRRQLKMSHDLPDNILIGSTDVSYSATTSLAKHITHEMPRSKVVRTRTISQMDQTRNIRNTRA